MASVRRARDHELLDALDACPRESFSGSAWRIVREGRDPMQGFPSGARWDPGTFDVLYTSLEREGALAEVFFHLNRQPVFPSKPRWFLHRLHSTTKGSLRLANLDHLNSLGVATSIYESLEYARCQEIGDAALFLGFDGLIVPSARWPCHNLVLFTDRIEPEAIRSEGSELVDWDAWRNRKA